MGTIICETGLDSVPELVMSVAALFAEDGGQRDRRMDSGWPKREGTHYYSTLVEDPDSLCLLAYPTTGPQGTALGHLIGRMARANPLRPDAVVAVLESMRVNPAHRRQGIGNLLMNHFRHWAVSQGANEASVTAYSANTSAINFYRHHGFAPFELTLHQTL